MSRVNTPPSVSMPRHSGVTSSRRTSLTSPCSTPAWIAAPMATTSSGLTPTCGSLPKKSFTFSRTSGMRVMPPTRTTSSMSFASSPASLSAFLHGSMVRATRSATSFSRSERLIVSTRWSGVEAPPSMRAVMNGWLTSVVWAEHNSILAFSAASLSRCSASRSVRRSMPSFALNLSARKLTILASKSSPPRKVSPLVDFTSNTPSPISRIETSNVPPPRS